MPPTFFIYITLATELEEVMLIIMVYALYIVYLEENDHCFHQLGVRKKK